MPFQIIGRLIGATINSMVPYYFSLITTCGLLLYLTVKLVYKGIQEWKTESLVIAHLHSEKFISMNIIKSSELNQIVENVSNSNSSFSINSDKYENKGMVPFNIEEESYEDDSVHRPNNLKMPDNLSIEYSNNLSLYSKKRQVNDVDEDSNASSLNPKQRDRFKLKRDHAKTEQTHFNLHNLFFIGKSLVLAGHWFYHSRNDPKPYEE